jgi:hypothetical protein
VTATSQHVFEDKAVEQNWASALEQKPTTERAQIVRADYSKLIASGPRQEVAARKKNMRLLCNETAIISHYGCVPRLFGKRFYNFWNYFPILDAGGRCHFYSMGASFVYAERMSNESHRRNYFARDWGCHDLFRKSERAGAITHFPRLDRWASLLIDRDDSRHLWHCGDYRELAFLILS